MNNLGQLVCWQDGKGEQGGGWHTGREVLYPDAIANYWVYINESGVEEEMLLIQESCCGTLTWVESSLLKPYLTREERGEE